MKGKVISWKGDKGFGFISPEGENEHVFFHISSVKKADRNPEIGDTVIFEVTKDHQGRLKASHVLVEGVPLANSESSKKIITEPVKKDILDYFAYLILAVLLAISLGLLIKTDTPEAALLPGAIFLVVIFFISNRKKQPANKLFSCSKCHVISSHDKRTVAAWNSGFDRLYCQSCHQEWLRTQSNERQEGSSTYVLPKSGCLGLFLIVMFVPVIYIVGVAARWIV